MPTRVDAHLWSLFTISRWRHPPHNVDKVPNMLSWAIRFPFPLSHVDFTNLSSPNKDDTSNKFQKRNTHLIMFSLLRKYLLLFSWMPKGISTRCSTHVRVRNRAQGAQLGLVYLNDVLTIKYIGFQSHGLMTLIKSLLRQNITSHCWA